LESGKQETRIKPETGAVTEEGFTNALIRVSRDERKVVYVLEGHGEHRIDEADQGGYSHVKESLEREGFEVKTLAILKEGRIPQDAAVVVIGGPQRMFVEGEKEAIRQYLQNQGQLLFMMDPQDRTGLDDLLAEWGLTLGDEMIVDASPNLMLLGFDASNSLVMSYTGHEIVKDLRLATLFPVSRPVLFSPPAGQEVDYQPLAKTSPESWGETDFSIREVRFDPVRDRKGPLDIAAALEFRKAEEGESAGAMARVVVIGDSDFATNGFFNFSGNSDFFLSAIHWLAEEKDLISIRPKESKASPLILTQTQGRIFFYIPIIVLPGVVIVTGVTIWRKRKRL
jgi:ABC-type uncharacterized transport system involved in gliding motility auxiliary subunit